jgi:hypothetical protein
LVRNKNIVTTCMNQLNNLLIQCFWSDSFSKWLRENNIFAEIGDYAKILFSHSKPNQSYCAKIIFSQSNFHGCQVVASRRKVKILGDESKGLHNRRAKFHQSFLINISFWINNA